MGAIEIFAGVVVLLSLIKLITLLVSPKSWINFASKLWKNPSAMAFVSLILGAIVFYYLIQELTIIQIFAVMLFTMLLFALTFASYSKEFYPMLQKFAKQGILKKGWLPILIWVILLIWAIKELFLTPI